MHTGNYFIDSLPDEIRRKLKPHIQVEKPAKRRQLCAEGKPVEIIYFPLTAVVSKYQAAGGSRAVETSLTGREGAVGMASAFNSNRASIGSSEVLLSGFTLKIDAKTFLKIAEGEARLKSIAVQTIDSETKRKTRRIVCNRYHTVEQRLCTWLLRLVDRCELTSLNVTQSDIARALGIHRPTVTEGCHILRDQHIIRQSNGAVEIANPEQLEKLACECRFSHNPFQKK